MSPELHYFIMTVTSHSLNGVPCCTKVPLALKLGKRKPYERMYLGNRKSRVCTVEITSVHRLASRKEKYQRHRLVIYLGRTPEIVIFEAQYLSKRQG